MGAAVTELDASGLSISPEIRSRLSPLVHERIISMAGTRSSAHTATTPFARCATQLPPGNRSEQQSAASAISQRESGGGPNLAGDCHPSFLG